MNNSGNMNLEDYKYLIALKKNDPERYQELLKDISDVSGDIVEATIKMMKKRAKEIEEAVKEE
jgi:hypothetical protein